MREYAAQIGIGELAPHDLRRTAAKLCRSKGGELEQIQFLLGHESILTTERYLGSEPVSYTHLIHRSYPAHPGVQGLFRERSQGDRPWLHRAVRLGSILLCIEINGVSDGSEGKLWRSIRSRPD